MSACTKHAAKPVRGYSDCPGCEVENLRQQLAAAQAEARELRALVTEFANLTRDSGWLYVADELEQRLAAIAPQPAEQPADRKRRGEPVAWPLASPEDAGKGWTLDYRFIERVERAARQRTNYTTSMEATEQVLIAAAEILGAPQTAETDLEVESLRQQLAAAQVEVRKLRERAEKAERNYQWMVERAADQHLSGYRELARRAADAENEADGLRTALARVRELAAKWRAAPQDPEEPLLATAADELEAAISQAGESLPLMARREWMCRDTDYFVVHGDFCLEVESFRGKAPRYAADGSLIVIGDSAVCDQVDAEAQPDGIYRVADTDEHGLKVIPRTADMPEDVTHMTLHTRRFFRAGELRARSVEGDEGLVRIEDYRPAAQES